MFTSEISNGTESFSFVQNPKDSSTRFTAFSYLSWKVTARLWQGTDLSPVQKEGKETSVSCFSYCPYSSNTWGTLSCHTSGERTCFSQILVAYDKKSSMPYQLPPNSCTLIQDPKCHTFSWDCWSFTELYKYQRIFLLSTHWTTTADPLLTELQEYSHLQFNSVIIYTEQWFLTEFTVVFIKL